MKRDVGDMLRTLIQEQEAKDTKETAAAEARTELTTLGVPLVRKSDRHYVIDVTNIHIFRNLHTFVQLLVNEVIEQCAFGIADIMVRRKVDANLTPEFAATGIDWIMIYVRLDAADHLPFDHRNFGNCMQVIFRSLQTQKWGGILFPEFFGLDTAKGDGAPPALLFPFHLHDREDRGGNYFLVEFSRPGRFLRITIEDAASSRLQLKHIPHRVVDQTVRTSYLAAIYPTAEKIHQGILHEAMNNRAEFVENASRLTDFFAYLRQEGLPRLQNLHFSWPTDDRQMLFLEKRRDADVEPESLRIMAQEIQLLEAPAILQLLARGNILEMISGPFHIYFDVSRYGVCLNVSFDEWRQVLGLEAYFGRMPALARTANERKGALEKVRLFLIHHPTAEVIGLIKAFADAGCTALATFFVKYSGIVPDVYLETLMALPPESFRFYALQKIESRTRLAGLYTLSRQFTPLDDLAAVDNALAAGQRDFLESMRLAAGHVFLREMMTARKNGESLLLVEDGGYLAPLLNRFCLQNKTVHETFDYFQMKPASGDERQSIAKWLAPTFLGSVEHTKNGYDCIAEVMTEFGKLQFPAATIAVSDLKRGSEARECARSILNATESILNRLGLLFSRRRAVVLGSAGAIGGFLKEELCLRLPTGSLSGVDIAAPESPSGVPEVKTVNALGTDILRRADLFIGVIGASILKQNHIEDIIVNGRSKEVFFISGSTKTVEFSDLQNYLQSLHDLASPQIGGKRVKVDFLTLRDLQTGILQGYQAMIVFPDDPARNKTFYLLGEGMPINFLYYGIPREIVDEVMSQLFSVACGVVRRERSENRLARSLLAVDRAIDVDANPLLRK